MVMRDPDLLVQAAKVNRLVLDTKWKLIDGQKAIHAAMLTGLDSEWFGCELNTTNLNKNLG